VISPDALRVKREECLALSPGQRTAPTPPSRTVLDKTRRRRLPGLTRTVRNRSRRNRSCVPTGNLASPRSPAKHRVSPGQG